MADQGVVAQPVELTAGTQGSLNDTVPSMPEGTGIQEPEEPSHETSAKNEGAARATSAGSNRGAAGEKDDSVETGAGSMEATPRNNEGPEAVADSTPADQGAAQTLVEDEKRAANVEEGGVQDSAEANQASIEGTSPGLESTSLAEIQSGDSAAEPDGTTLPEQEMGSRRASSAVEEEGGQVEGDLGVAQELNELLGNTDVANEQVEPSGDSMEEQGGGEIEVSSRRGSPKRCAVSL